MTKFAQVLQLLVSLIAGFLISIAYFGYRDTLYHCIAKSVDVQTAKGFNASGLLLVESDVHSILRQHFELLCIITTSIHRTKHQRAILDTWGLRCDMTILIVGRKKPSVTTRTGTTPDSNNSSMLPENPLDNLSSLPKDRSNLDSAQSGERHRTSRSKAPCINFDVEILTPSVKIVTFDMVDVYANLWQKTKLAMQYIVDEEQFDWVLKVDDDSYVIVENLRTFLLAKDPAAPFYYGFHYKPNAPKGFNSGGSGYVMSRQIAQAFVGLLRGNLTALTQGSNCPRAADSGPEDVYIANCLYALNITPADTRDEDGRPRFLPVQLEAAISGTSIPGWFWGLLLNKFEPGLNCCSDSAISFHYVSPEFMRVMEYLIYYLHPFSSRLVTKASTRDHGDLFDQYFSSKSSQSAKLNISTATGCVRLHN